MGQHSNVTLWLVQLFDKNYALEANHNKLDIIADLCSEHSWMIGIYKVLDAQVFLDYAKVFMKVNSNYSDYSLSINGRLMLNK